MKLSHKEKEIFYKKNSIGKFISFGAIFTSISVIFQSAPVLLPAIGLVISPFSTLPVALAASYSITLGMAVYISTALLLAFVYVQESVIFLFTTGLIGLATGSLLIRKGITISVLISSILLSLGMFVLTFLLEIKVFGDFTSSLTLPIIFILFPLVYVTIWNIGIKKFVRNFNHSIKK